MWEGTASAAQRPRGHRDPTPGARRRIIVVLPALLALIPGASASARQVPDVRVPASDVARSREDERPLSPGTATLLAVLIPGAGHVYAGESRKGVALLATVILPTVIADRVRDNRLAWTLAGVSIAAWIYGIVDAGAAVARHDERTRTAAGRISPLLSTTPDGRRPAIGIRIRT